MAKKHDESKDLIRVSRVCGVDYSDKLIRVRDKSKIGIKTWGRIDFLVHYCGWHCIYDRTAAIIDGSDESGKSYREIKKENKQHKLSNKRDGNKRSKAEAQD